MLFAPEDLELVRGDPAERRRFLDELLVSRTPRLAGVRADYDRVLKQRNALLKTARLARGNALETLDVWDGHLADLGGQLLAARLALVADLAPHLAARYADVAGPDAQDGKLLLLACRRERPDRTTHHRDARAAWLTRKLYTELCIGRFFDSWSPEVAVFIGRSAEI